MASNATGSQKRLVADLWRNLEEADWSRLRTLHVPPKLLKGDSGDRRAWMQFKEAQQCAVQRAEREAPHELLQVIQASDQWRSEVYAAAAERIEALLQDKDHYMRDKLTKVDPEFKVKVHAPKGRIEIVQKLTQRMPAEGVKGQRQWMHKGSGIQCRACGMNIKASSTHSEISKKDGSICAGTRSKTLTQQMQELVDTSAQLPEKVPGHRGGLRAHKFSCQRCWCNLPKRCGKAALTTLTGLDCQFGPIHEGELQLRARLHTSHTFWRRGEWVSCERCNRSAEPRDGKVLSWMDAECSKQAGEQRLSFGTTSSGS